MSKVTINKYINQQVTLLDTIEKYIMIILLAPIWQEPSWSWL